MEEKFSTIIKNSKSVLVVLPKGPYFDQVATGLSLYLALTEKNVRIVCPSPMLVEFNRLVGVDKIKSEIGNKNLTITFNEYNPNDVERVNADVENGKFKLTVVPKPGKASPSEEQLNINYAGLEADTIVLIGGANEGHFPILSEQDFVGARIVHVGVSELSLSNKINVESFVRTSSSTSEIMTSLIKGMGGRIESDIATNLLMGIYEGSKNFSTKYVTPETFEIASELMKAGAVVNQGKIERSSFPEGSLPEEAPEQATGPLHASGEEDGAENTPKSWFEPKIIKGTSRE